MVNVKDHGATGDGTTDDTSAIASAVSSIPAAGGTLLVPPGIYRVLGDSAVNVAGKNDLTICGEGASSVLRLEGATGTPSLLGVGTQSNLHVKDLALHNAVTLVRTDHVKGSLSSPAAHWIFERVHFTSEGSAATSQPYIFNVDAGAAGRLSGVHISGCRFDNTVSYAALQVSGLLLRGVYDTHILNNTFRNINNPIVPDSIYQKEGLVYSGNIEIVDQDLVHSEGPDIWGWNKVVVSHNVQRDLVSHTGDVRSCGGLLIDSGSGVGCTDVMIVGNIFVRNPVQIQARPGTGNVCKNILVAANVIRGQRTGTGYNADVVIYDPGVAGQLDSISVTGNILKGSAPNRIIQPPAGNITNLQIQHNIGYP